MNDQPARPSALDDYRATFGNRFDLRQLWRDRKAILAQPRIAAEPAPPLSMSPLRFALTLAVLPMLALGWASSQLATLAYPDGRPPSATEAIARAIEAPLESFLLPADADRIAAWGRVKSATLPAASVALYENGKQRLTTTPTKIDAVAARQAVDAFVLELSQSGLSTEQRNIVAAKLLLRTRIARRLEGFGSGLMRSFFEGGAAAQAVGALSLLVSAWMFRRFVRRDARFARRERADQFYLYYVTSRLFWLSLLSIVCYGVVAFASASADVVLMSRANSVNQLLLVVSLVYLLARSREIARALSDGDELPAGATRSIAWRMLLSQLLANIAVIAVALLLGIVVGIAAGYWFASR
jgi:hypothetical protein